MNTNGRSVPRVFHIIIRGKIDLPRWQALLLGTLPFLWCCKFLIVLSKWVIHWGNSEVLLNFSCESAGVFTIFGWSHKRHILVSQICHHMVWESHTGFSNPPS